jgi:uncharacterized repeat protein (TIGR01451 family)
MHVGLAMTAALTLASLFAATRTDAAPYPTAPITVLELTHDVSPPLGELAREAGSPTARLAAALGAGIGSGDLLGPIQNFEGLSNDDNGSSPGDRMSPPDANGDVGPRHYVQWVNASLAVYDKQGLRLLGPVPGSVVWSGFGLGEPAVSAARLCETTNRGDPIVLYDQLADRWLLTQFAWSRIGAKRTPPYVQCIAVSATGDPTGRYFRYAFRTPDDLFNDYAKLGVWFNAYLLTYIATNDNADEDEATQLAGSGVLALNRSQMLSGLAADAVYALATDAPPLLAADLDGPAEPGGSSRPLGDPLLVGIEDHVDDIQDALELWRFHVDFADPARSVLAGPALVPTHPFDSQLCPEAACVSQRGDGQRLDALSDRLMSRADYRRFDDHDTLTLSQTIRADTSGRAGIRWYELHRTVSVFEIAREGTIASSDTINRWLPSIAVDRLGDLGIVFSTAGPDEFPSIGYTGVAALPVEPAVAFPGESRLAVGGGAQSEQSRWGDYAAISVDPVDGCTFWLTQEYYPKTSPDGWHTRIGSFRFPTCGAVPTISGVAREGEPLTAATGEWPELPGASFRFQWRRCDAFGERCTDIPGADGATYTLGAADVDWTLRVAVTASAAVGVSSSLSRPTALVNPIPSANPVDLAVAIEPAALTARIGDHVELTIRVANNGGGTGTDVQLTAQVPPQLRLLAYRADRGPGCTGLTGVVCDLDYLPVGRTAEIKFTLQVDGRGISTVTARARAQQVDPDPATNIDSASIVATGPPQLTLLGAAKAQPGARADVITLKARVSIDEPAALTLTAAVGGTRLPLLAGTTLAGERLRAPAAQIAARARRAGVIEFDARLPARAIGGGAFELRLRATDGNGEASVLRIPATTPQP